MHLVFAARGNKTFQDLFINGLNALMVPFKNDLKVQVKDLNGNIVSPTHVQVMVQPIQLYSLVFPKENWDMIATTVLGNNPDGQREGFVQKSIIKGAQLAMGLDSIPEYKKDMMYPILREGVETIGIGIKEDGVLNDGKTEAL